MKRERIPIHKNENLVKLLLSYLNCRDLSQISQVSKNLNRVSNTYFDHYWREECNSQFCSSYDYNKIFDIETNLNHKNEARSCLIEEYFTSHFDSNISQAEKYSNWKERMKMGTEIKCGWSNLELHGAIADPILIEDIEKIRTEIYGNLKEYLALPKLRKENHHVESDLNTILQTYLYDFLYDQQDLYEYYNDIFFNKNYLGESILVKSSDLPLADSLENFPTVLKEFQSQNELNCLAKLRWYIYDNIPEHNEKCQMNDDLYKKNCFESNLKINNVPDQLEKLVLTSKLIEKLQNCTGNRLIFILNCLNLTVTHFCQITYNYIMKNFNNDYSFLNEYLKRYKSFVESAIYMNDYLENLNVLVNYIYEMTHKQYPIFPKFSVLRLMILTWNREVLNKINSPSNKQYPICDKIINLYSKFLNKELNRITTNNHIFNMNDFVLNKLNSTKSKYDKEFTHEDLVVNNFDDNLSLISLSTNYSNVKNCTTFISNGNPFSTLKNSMDINCEKTSNDEAYDDFVTSSLIKHICNVMLDTSFNEYSVFNFNKSTLETSDSFKEIEDGLVEVVEKLINSYYANRQQNGDSPINTLKDILTYFKTSNFHLTHFNNKLKFLIYSKVHDCVRKLCHEEMSKKFLIYTKEFNFYNISSKDIQHYFKVFGNDLENKYEDIYHYISKFTLPNLVNADAEMVNYFLIYFIREQLKSPISIISIFEENEDWFEEIQTKLNNRNKQVEKEMKRRNIHQLFSEGQIMLLSFEKKTNWNTISQLYEIENALNTKDPPNDDPNLLKNMNNISLDIQSSLNLDLNLDLQLTNSFEDY